jgi:cytochrome c553
VKDWKTAFPEVYMVPKLTGQKSAYIVSALKAYKSGERDFATMRAIAADLSDKDMEDIAAYYGQAATTTAGHEMTDRHPPRIPQFLGPSALFGGARHRRLRWSAEVGPQEIPSPARPATAKRASARAPSFRILAGQHQDYLVAAINHYKNGKRKNPIMQGQVANLTQRDILDLTAHYARLPGLKQP